MVEVTNQEMYSTKGYFDNLDTKRLLGWWIGSTCTPDGEGISKENIAAGVETITEMKQWCHENEIPIEHFVQIAEAMKILWAEAIANDDDLAAFLTVEHCEAFQNALMGTLVATYAFCATHMLKE